MTNPGYKRWYGALSALSRINNGPGCPQSLVNIHKIDLQLVLAGESGCDEPEMRALIDVVLVGSAAVSQPSVGGDETAELSVVGPVATSLAPLHTPPRRSLRRQRCSCRGKCCKTFTSKHRDSWRQIRNKSQKERTRQERVCKGRGRGGYSCRRQHVGPPPPPPQQQQQLDTSTPSQSGTYPKPPVPPTAPGRTHVHRPCKVSVVHISKA